MSLKKKISIAKIVLMFALSENSIVFFKTKSEPSVTSTYEDQLCQLNFQINFAVSFQRKSAINQEN